MVAQTRNPLLKRHMTIDEGVLCFSKKQNAANNGVLDMLAKRCKNACTLVTVHPVAETSNILLLFVSKDKKLHAAHARLVGMFEKAGNL